MKVSPCLIPFHYSECVHKQLQEMAQEGIIGCSNSPRCAFVVYVPKKNGEFCICIGFIQLNKITKKMPTPCPELKAPKEDSNIRLFSKIYLRSTYFPMSPDSIEKLPFALNRGMDYGNSLSCHVDLLEP